MLRILLIFFSLSFYQFAVGQSVTFSPRTDMPAARSAIGYAADGAYAYIANGLGPAVQYGTEIFKYDVAQDSWTTLTDQSLAKRFGSAALIATNLYVINGQRDDGTFNNRLEIIDTQTGNISFGAQNPNPVRAGGIAVYEDKIYSFGGRIDQFTWSDHLSVYNPDFNFWTQLAPLPIAQETKGTIVAGKLYVVGGFNGAISDQVFVYNIDQGIWEDPIQMPFGVSASAVTSTDSQVTIVGDFSNLTLLAAYDVNTEEFQVFNTENLAEGRHRGAAHINGELYVFGGNVASDIGSAIATVQSTVLLTSTEEIVNLNSIDLFPNPTVDLIQWKEKFDNVSILNQNGQRVATIEKNIQLLDVSQYPAGTYYFKATIADKIYLSKWIKL